MIVIIDELSLESDLSKEIDLVLRNLERKKDTKRYSLNNLKINRCIGCFSCWLKTPGVCIFKDDVQKIIKEIIKSDKLIYVSNIRYGSHGIKIKTFLERSIPLATPFFDIRHGRLHHKERYEKYPDIIFIGYGENISENEEKVFKELCNANVVNMHKDKCECVIVKNNNVCTLEKVIKGL